MATRAITEAKFKEMLTSALLPISAEVAKINDHQSDIEKKVEKNYKYLFGNGDAGLDERVRNLEQKLDKQTKAFQWVGVIAGGYLIVEIIKILASHL